jgi:hypothetical protein
MRLRTLLRLLIPFKTTQGAPSNACATPAPNQLKRRCRQTANIVNTTTIFVRHPLLSIVENPMFLALYPQSAKMIAACS